MFLALFSLSYSTLIHIKITRVIVMHYSVYFVSDHTGLTIESLGQSLLSQFEGMSIKTQMVPYVNTEEKARKLAQSLEHEQTDSDMTVIVFASMADMSLREQFYNASFVYYDLFDMFLPSLETIFDKKALEVVGKSHNIADDPNYMNRIEAVDFTLQHDDGLGTDEYDKADLILIGVSRSGKTPTSLYLAIKFGIKTANYPLVPQDWRSCDSLPAILEPYKHKLFGLLVESNRLYQIRQERFPNSEYASMKQCRNDVNRTKALYQMCKLPYLEASSLSVEEIATQIVFYNKQVNGQGLTNK